MEDYVLKGGSVSNFLRNYLSKVHFQEIRTGEESGTLTEKLLEIGPSMRETVAKPGRSTQHTNLVIQVLIVLLFPISFLATNSSYTGQSKPAILTPAPDLFRPQRVSDSLSLVQLGREIPLFALSSEGNWEAGTRARTVVDRLNEFYGVACTTCDFYKLRPRDIRIGKFVRAGTQHGDIVVFYSHIDQGIPVVKPTILVTVSPAQADELKVTPATLACHWRDITRDILALALGMPSEHSPLGPELSSDLQQLRHSLDEPTIERLRSSLQTLTAAQRYRLANAYKEISPDYVPKPEFYTPIKSPDGVYHSLAE
jgi:hypothetical protein